MKSKTLPLILFLFFLFLLYPSITTNVKGATVTYSYDFESTTATHQVSSGESGFFYTYADINPSECMVDTTYAYDGSKSYMVGDGVNPETSQAFFNSSLGDSVYLINATWYFLFASGDVTNPGSVCAYWSFYDFDNTNLIYLGLISDGNAGSCDLFYTDHNGVKQTFGQNLPDDLFHKIGFEYTANDSISYWCLENDGTFWSVNEVQPYHVVDTPQWNYTRVNTQLIMDTSGQWIDLFNVTISSTPLSGGGGSIFDLSDYEKYCEGESMSGYTLPSNKYIENKFNFKLDTQINVVDLYVTAEQLNEVSSNQGDYFLYVNGVPANNPDVIFLDSPTEYILRWYDVNVNINNEYPIFEFYCTQYTIVAGQKFYWRGLGVETEGGEFKYHNNANYLDGVYDGTTKPFGLMMCFYSSGTVPEVPEYADEDNIFPMQRNNNDEYLELETLVFGYTISTNSPVTYIQLLKGGTRILTQGYGGNGMIALPYSGTCSFYPNENSQGSYSIKLIRNGINQSFYNFTIINRSNPIDYNANIGTYPVPSGDGAEFTITWLYNKTYYSNQPATIVYSNQNFIESGNYNTIKSFIYDSGNMPFTIKNENPKMAQYWFFLCILESGTLYPVASCPHYVGDYFTNEIHTDKSEYVLQSHPSYAHKVAKVQIYGSHTYLNGDIYLLVNDGAKLKYYLGQTNTINKEWDVFSTGYYKLDLVVYTTNSSYKILDTTSFTVVLSPTEGQPSIFPTIHDTVIKAFLTMILVLIMTFSPLLVAGAFHYPISNVPGMVYALSSTLGCCFAVMLGWAELWLPFTIIVVGVIVALLLYIRGQNK